MTLITVTDRGSAGAGLLAATLAATLAAMVVLPIAGCRPYAGSGGVTRTAVTQRRGTILFTVVAPEGAGVTRSSITPDGLVLTGPISDVEAGKGALGEANPAEVGEVIGIAVRDGFFSWESTLPVVGASAERRDRAVALVLAITAEPGRPAVGTAEQGSPGTGAAEPELGPTMSNTVTVVSLQEAPPMVKELIAQVRGLVSQAAARPFDRETAGAILAAKALLAGKRRTMKPGELDGGPCLAEELIPGWSADVAHDPRAAADDDPRNMCRSFGAGDTRHLVELAPNGDFIQVR